jgi:gamma-glutamylcyclotransferase (GGCT)/AIG2-like uncharacterized protein YtfP
MRSVEYGDVIFPIVSEVSDPWSGDTYRNEIVKKSIREDYFIEIRNILNSYTYGKEYIYAINGPEYRITGPLYDFPKLFLEHFDRVKGITRNDGQESYFKWLNLKEAKEAIKRWDGNPEDILYYLTHSKIIERAVEIEYSKRVQK